MCKLIAFCGVDGSGKSTLINRLEEKRLIDNALYIRKQIRTNTELVMQYHKRNFKNSQDWIKGTFAETVSVASALDFLAHYKKEIEPHLLHNKLIICDRYSQCFEAYHFATGYKLKISHLFEPIRKPDLIVFVDAPMDTLQERYNKRGGASEDESIEVMEKYREAYLHIFQEIDVQVATVINNANFEAAFEQTLTILSSIVDFSGDA